MLEDVPPDSKKCRCSCGKEVIVLTHNLTNGNTKSCGCLQKDRASETNFIDLSGQKFGKLTVVKRVENNRYGVCYQCRCECGGLAIVSATNLRNGNTSSCGCLKSKGEMVINKWLQKHNVPFEAQKSFDNIILESGRRPFYDFCIYDNNGNVKCLIEYNGRQHYEITGGWNDEITFQATQSRDEQKEILAELNGYPLYIIRFDEDIEDALQRIFMEEAESLVDENDN